MSKFLVLLVIPVLLTLDVKSQSADSLYSSAMALYEKGEYQKALVRLEPALRSDSTNINFLILEGNTLKQLKDFRGAYEAYSNLIRFHPRESSGYNQRGLLLQKLLKTEESIKDFTTALGFETSDTNRISLFVNRGASKINKRDFQGAYNDFYQALQIDSLNIGILNNIATVTDEVGRGNETLVYLNRILQIDSTFIGAYANIGFKYQEMGDYKKAILYYNKVLELDKNEPLGYSNRSYNYYMLKDYPNALADIHISLKLYPTNSYALKVRALIYLALNQPKKACADMAEALQQGYTEMYGDEVKNLQLRYCK